jgi:hypothetical protein
MVKLFLFNIGWENSIVIIFLLCLVILMFVGFMFECRDTNRKELECDIERYNL